MSQIQWLQVLELQGAFERNKESFGFVTSCTPEVSKKIITFCFFTETKSLVKGLAVFFYKNQTVHIFSLCSPSNLCCNHSTLLL